MGSGKILLVDVQKWCNNLFTQDGVGAKTYLNNRGLTDDTLRTYQIGFDTEKRGITVPLAIEGNEVGVLKWFSFKDNGFEGRKKISSHGSAVLYGSDKIVDANQVIVCEGEFDCLLLRQHGFDAITGTAGAGTWKKEWSPFLEGKEVTLCYDSDEAGRKGAIEVARKLHGKAKSVKEIDLFADSATPELKDVTDYFVKTGKTSDDFRALLDGAKDMTAAEGEDPLIEALLKEEGQKKMHPAQDYSDGLMYYGLHIKKNIHLLSSDRHIWSNDQLSQKGIHLLTKQIRHPRLSGETIINFINGKSTCDPLTIFLDISQYIRRYIMLKESEAYTYLALWTMGTYVFKIFRYYPYVHITGEKQTGKSLLMEILAPICFNGEVSLNPTEAVLFRDIHTNLPTIFLDEVERFRKQDREKYGAIQEVLKSGFVCNGSVKRCAGKDKDRIDQFSTYCPKMFAGINDLDDVLRDRAVTIPMVRRLKNEPVERYMQNTSTIQFQARLCNELYVFGLSLGAEIASRYLNEHLSIQGIEHLSNREYDIWLPILLMANILDEYGDEDLNPLTMAMLTYSRKCHQDRLKDDAMDNDTAKLLHVFNQFRSEENPDSEDGAIHYYDTARVYEYFKEQEEYAWLTSKGQLSRQLRRIHIRSKTCKVLGKSQRQYAIDTGDLEELTQRYLVDQGTDGNVTGENSVTDGNHDSAPF